MAHGGTMRHLRNIILILLALLITVTPFTLAVYENADIYFNSELIDFVTSGAYYDAQAECIMLPLREFAEDIGAKADYDINSGEIILTIFNNSVKLKLDSSEAVINGTRIVELTASPVIYNDTAYIPIDIFTKCAGMDYKWEPDTMSAYLTLPKEYKLGISADQAMLSFGIPDRSDRSEQGFEWFVYTSVPTRYLMAGMIDSSIAAYFLCGENWELECGIYSSMRGENADSLMNIKKYNITASTNSVTYSNDEEYITVYLKEDGTVFAALYGLMKYKDRYDIIEATLASFSLELLDITNVYRAVNGYPPIAVNADISTIAKKQSSDMAENNFFSHKNSQGFSSSERLTAAGYSQFYSAEAIAEAYRNSFEAFAALIKDEGYRKMICADFTDFGCGASYNENSDGLLYFSQIFYAVKN